MKHLIIPFLILAVGCQPRSKPIVQESPLTDTLETPTLPPDEIKCGFHQSGKRPETTFPFSESDSIELVSYEAKPRLMKIHNDELIRDGKFIVPNIHQRVTLTKSKTDNLFSILYNFTEGVDSLGADCYMPHQSVVFYKKDRAIAFLEICFSCGGTRQTKGLDIGFSCFGKYCILERFFIQNKVDYGLILEQYDVECASTFEKEKNHQ